MKTKRVDFKTENFETFGYYYSKPDLSDKNSKCYVFYKNGVFFGGFSVGRSKDDIKQFLLDTNRVNMAKKLPYHWGVFQVNNDSIIFEKWISADAFSGYPTIKYYGKVINKKTIVINTPKVFSISQPPNEFKSDTLYFSPIKLKPDSLNIFIK